MELKELKKAVKKAEKRVNTKIYERINEMRRDPAIMAEIDREIAEKGTKAILEGK